MWKDAIDSGTTGTNIVQVDDADDPFFIASEFGITHFTIKPHSDLPELLDLLRDEYDQYITDLFDILNEIAFLQVYVEFSCREEEVIKWMLHDIHT